ncbi:ABC transporter substrate-binding protein [Paracoccus jiaweipingae]|uniref:ABC transporter substrate-binding protein n=1 Tax=unclassified Paracoccus (in: a-proteobacteria) TaxID=2688777 RepID=UPI0037B53A57
MQRITLLLSTALTGIALTTAAMAGDTLTVLSWGGAYSEAQKTAFARPFEEKTGIKVTMADTDNPATPIKAEVEAGNVTSDVASVGYADAMRLCDEGLVQEIDPDMLEKGADGSAPQDDFLPNGLGDCFVATDVYSTVIAYDGSKYQGDAAPKSVADFFDLDAFPGKRGMRKDAHFNMEMALMADGVPADQVYQVLATDEGVARAFKKLDSIKSQIVWWEAGAQPIQLLADGEVALTLAYNGRVFNAAVDEGKPFRILWDGQIYEMEGWVIPKGAPNQQAALDFVAFSTGPEPLARAAEQISYGPPRKSSQGLVGKYKDSDVDMPPNLPTAPENMGNALASDVEFWVDHAAELNERFAAWLAG